MAVCRFSMVFQCGCCVLAAARPPRKAKAATTSVTSGNLMRMFHLLANSLCGPGARAGRCPGRSGPVGNPGERGAAPLANHVDSVFLFGQAGVQEFSRGAAHP